MSAWRQTGVIPSDPSIVLNQLKKPPSRPTSSLEQPRPSSSDSGSIITKILGPRGEQQLRTLLSGVMKEVIDAATAEQLRKFETAFQHLRTENSILKREIEGFRRSIIHQKARAIKFGACNVYIESSASPNWSWSRFALTISIIMANTLEPLKQEHHVARD
ncbi:hypothetical protein EJ05DRAFT_269793 [Pseudovirgaria hyperparasitica]|uniref:Uncharacterized protein n=1 Tax=Pseudovirgaria hyperparasitica TaxID=470096 RepID=A0A6A6VTN9_9PEZI|nr:uncharacterized protein EJ05DRAFT_269793 [Pseudovirgaria hyperparasitica]KAF2752641.1 hypothetical protein EJ05DRAFT_269793 [Pseudovirgaria hyperparasitica]